MKNLRINRPAVPLGKAAIILALAQLLILFPSYSSASLIQGEAAEFTILGLEGGSVIINSATSIEGNVGYGKNVTSETNQKVDNFDGTAYAHSSATFKYTTSTYMPSGGINIGGDADKLLEQANADALSTASYLASLTATVDLGALGDGDSLTLKSQEDLNVYSLDSLKYKEDTLELVGRSGFDDKVVFNVAGNFDFDNSEIKLTGVSAENVVFNFLNSSAINIGKSGSIFLGAILAPTGDVDYHNPATFIGSIIAKDINLHSDFNVAAVQINPVPVPGAFALFLTGLLGLAFSRRKID